MTPDELRAQRRRNADLALMRIGSLRRPFCGRCVWMTGWTDKATAQRDLEAHQASAAHRYWTGTEATILTWAEVRGLDTWVRA